MRRILQLGLLILVALPLVASAQEVKVKTFLYNYEVGSTSYTYCKVDLSRGPATGRAQLKTTGSSTTVVSNTTNAGAFRGMGVGDIIQVCEDATCTNRSIITYTDENTVVVDTAVNWSGGKNFKWTDVQCGTGAEDGWMGISGSIGVLIAYDLSALASTSVEVKPECRQGGVGAPVVLCSSDLAEVSKTATGVDYFSIKNSEAPFTDIRFGFKVTGEGGTDTLSATISAYYQGR